MVKCRYYQVVCPCGKTHEATQMQAGGSIPCECGINLSIPSFRELKTLPYEDREETAAPSAHLSLDAEAGVRQKRMGVLCFLMVVALISGGLAAYWYATFPEVPRVEEMSIFDTWRLWQETLRPGIAAPQTRLERMIEENQSVCRRWIYVASSICAFSLISSLGLLFLKARKHESPKRKRGSA
ncbi:MAG: hypothetical protein Q4D38_02605 [Planctomycetia bacterium]|nr:hypothetical protein [Planctomycetia bacterium]